MVEISVIRQDVERVKEGLRVRNWSEEQIQVVDQVLELDDKRKQFQSKIDGLKEESNKYSKEIGQLFKTGKQSEATELKQKVADLKEEIKTSEEEAKIVVETLGNLMYSIPNIPNPLVPKGATEEDNEVFKAWEEALPELGEDAKPHWELAKDYNLFDMELGVKITGAGFPLYRGQGAKLQRALINFFLDRADAAGYEEVIPPHLVNEDSARGTGQLPDKEGQMYYAEKDDLYLIPTAEVPVTNIFRNEILPDTNFSHKLCGYTPCFRREAGSYGAHVRGLNRVHQFDKVEIVRVEHPDRSYAALEEMIEHVASLLKDLGLPYRILRLCGGDLGFTSAITYDFEVYSAAQKRWLEVSSVSNFETYQSNRLKLRYKDGKAKHLAHTLNGSALALARVVAALLENNQGPEGIAIPEVLRPYMGGKTHIS